MFTKEHTKLKDKFAKFKQFYLILYKANDFTSMRTLSSYI